MKQRTLSGFEKYGKCTRRARSGQLQEIVRINTERADSVRYGLASFRSARALGSARPISGSASNDSAKRTASAIQASFST
jgi:hypothetical protein